MTQFRLRKLASTTLHAWASLVSNFTSCQFPPRPLCFSQMESCWEGTMFFHQALSSCLGHSSSSPPFSLLFSTTRFPCQLLLEFSPWTRVGTPPLAQASTLHHCLDSATSLVPTPRDPIRPAPISFFIRSVAPASWLTVHSHLTWLDEYREEVPWCGECHHL